MERTSQLRKKEKRGGKPPVLPSKRGKAKRGAILKTAPLGKRVPSTHFDIERRNTRAGESPFDRIDWKKASCTIRDADGSVVFELKDIQVPVGWSQLAVDILVSKYCRKAGVPKSGHEISARQVVSRIAKTIRGFAQDHGYFDKKKAQVFEDELTYLLIHQMGAFNSPVWFNVGLWHEYGIEGSGGNFRFDAEEGEVKELKNNYEYPQGSACFIQSIDDDLMSIFDLVKSEARLFKYGSGTGTNFSKIRGSQETLSGGGNSSGLMSFLEVFDRGAGATKSGGTTRRAAKMVCLDMDHPEIENFVTWKMREERKVAALIAAGYSSDFNGEAYRTVSGQNSNNSVRISDDFMRAVQNGESWKTRARTTGEVVKEYKARDIWDKVAEAAWACADPGVQFDTTINDWHTCSKTDRIYASNPCSEYMFLDDSACNLASLNLVKFLREDGSFDIEGYRHACRVFITAQEVLVGLSSYPTSVIAKNSYDYRPLGLGYANLGTLLMLMGIPYDSDKGRAWASALTSIMCGHAYGVSAEEASELGPFEGFEKNRESMLRVIEKHREAAYEIDDSEIPSELAQAAREDWDRALELGEKYGYRNSQVTVLAPTGTIGLLMDCDTTGVEPDFALVKFKKLAGGGYFKIVNQSVPRALRNLGYTSTQIEEILKYILGTLNFEATPHLNEDWLRLKGFQIEDIRKIEKSLPMAFEISGAFNRFSLGDDLLNRLGVPRADFEKPEFDFLRWGGLTPKQIAEANEAICGTMTIEGAPFIREEDLPVFDCANKCGVKGKRFIQPMGHIRMMAATQPFLSGAISKTVNLPNETSVKDIKDIYLQSWKLGLKAVAVYRDGCKLSQPLSTKSDKDSSMKEEKEAEASTAQSAKPQEMQITYAPVRKKLPRKRTGFTQEAVIAGHKVFIRTGEYQDGNLGEIFIDMHKEGAAYRSMMNCFAIAVSMGLQYGVPLKQFVDKFVFTRFEPAGMVDGHPNVKLATSIVDYIFRVLGMEYLGRTDFLQVKPVVEVKRDPEEPSKLIASGAPMEGMRPQMELSIPSENQEEKKTASVSDHLGDLMGDAPPCDQCGHTTVRNGACYRCMNCGNSMGCS